MHPHSMTVLKLGRPGPKNRGLYVTEAGVFLGPDCMLARIWQGVDGRRRAAVRPEAELEMLLSAA